MTCDLATWLSRSRPELEADCRDAGIELRPHLGHDELALALANHHLEAGHALTTDGVLAVLPEGFGFVRMLDHNLAPSAVDAFVSPSQVRALNLRDGHRVRGPVRAPRGNERFLALLQIDRIGELSPDQLAAVVPFGARTPIVPTRPLAPIAADERDAWLTALATLAPWCCGHRVLVHAPAGAPIGGALAGIADGIQRASPHAQVTACLLQQAPERLATARQRAVASGWRCLATGLDEAPERDAALVELALQRARRHAEHGGDAVLLLDSLTALVHAVCRSRPPSGVWLQPGLDAKALQLPRQLFAAARQFAEGGSLTVLAGLHTAEAGSIDAAIAAEFATASNADIVLDTADDTCGLPFDAQRTRTRSEWLPADAAARQERDALRERLAQRPSR